MNFLDREKMPPKPTPTIHDVAREAGVSAATVSRALSQPERVSAQTRALVADAVSRTGYVVNLTARNLRRKRAGALVVLLPHLGNPFFSEILAGIETTAAAAGFSVFVADTQATPTDAPRILDYLNANGADGVVVLDGSFPEALLAPPGGRRPPVIFACEWAAGTTLPTIAIDNRAAARFAVRHLVGLGHRAIGHVRGPQGNVLTAEREAGFAAALVESGLPVRSDWMFPGDFSLASGAEAARLWLALAERPTALFCANDEMAMGFIAALHRAGVETPRDISVVGFDDIALAEHYIPPLTTIRQPRGEMGAAAARALIAAIEGRPAAANRIVLPTELVLRGSTARNGQ